MTLSQPVNDRKFPDSLPRAKPSAAKPRKRTIREWAIDWIRESPPTAKGGLTPAERETLYELTNWFPKDPKDFRVTPHIESRDFPTGYVRGLLDNLGGISRHSYIQRMKSLTDKGYVRKTKHGHGSRSGYVTLTTWELLADPATHLRSEYQETMDFRTKTTHAHEHSRGSNKPSPMSRANGLTPMPMSTAEGPSGAYKDDYSLHESLSTIACVPLSESNEKVDGERVLKNDQKRLFQDDSLQRLVDQLNGELGLTLSAKCNYCGRDGEWEYTDFNGEEYDGERGNFRKCIRVTTCAEADFRHQQEYGEAEDAESYEWKHSICLDEIHHNCRFLSGYTLIRDEFMIADFSHFGGGTRMLTAAEIGHVVRRVVKVEPDNEIGFVTKILADIAAGNENITRDLKTNLKTGLRNIQF